MRKKQGSQPTRQRRFADVSSAHKRQPSLLDRNHPGPARHVADSRQGARRNVGLDEANLRLELLRRPVRLERRGRRREDVHRRPREEMVEGRPVPARRQGPRLEGVADAEVAARRAGQRGRNLCLHVRQGNERGAAIRDPLSTPSGGGKGRRAARLRRRDIERQTQLRRLRPRRRLRPAGGGEISFRDPDLREPIRLSAAARRGLPRLRARQGPGKSSKRSCFPTR